MILNVANPCFHIMMHRSSWLLWCLRAVFTMEAIAALFLGNLAGMLHGGASMTLPEYQGLLITGYYVVGEDGTHWRLGFPIVILSKLKTSSDGPFLWTPKIAHHINLSSGFGCGNFELCRILLANSCNVFEWLGKILCEVVRLSSAVNKCSGIVGRYPSSSAGGKSRLSFTLKRNLGCQSCLQDVPTSLSSAVHRSYSLRKHHLFRRWLLRFKGAITCFRFFSACDGVLVFNNGHSRWFIMISSLQCNTGFLDGTCF